MHQVKPAQQRWASHRLSYLYLSVLSNTAPKPIHGQHSPPNPQPNKPPHPNFTQFLPLTSLYLPLTFLSSGEDDCTRDMWVWGGAEQKTKHVSDEKLAAQQTVDSENFSQRQTKSCRSVESLHNPHPPPSPKPVISWRGPHGSLMAIMTMIWKRVERR